MRRFPLVLGFVVLVGSGCASAPDGPSAPPSVDVTGTWVGSWALAGGIGGAYTLRLRQTGSKVLGELAIPGSVANSGALEGSVAENEFAFRLLSGASGGEFTVTGDEMRGYATGTGSRVLLRRRP